MTLPADVVKLLDEFEAAVHMRGYIWGSKSPGYDKHAEGTKAKRAALESAIERRVPEGWVMVPESALRWLNGEEGDFICPPENYFRGKPPAYWWRSEFRKRLSAASAGVRGE